jgi:hypothetical protein
MHVKKSHKDRLLRVRSVGAPVDYKAPFETRVMGVDGAEVSEVAHFFYVGTKYWWREDRAA